MLRTQASADESSWVTCEMEKYPELNTATLHGQQRKDGCADGWGAWKYWVHVAPKIRTWALLNCHTHGHCDNSVCDGFQPNVETRRRRSRFLGTWTGAFVCARRTRSITSQRMQSQSPAWSSPHCASAHVPFHLHAAPSRASPRDVPGHLSAQRATTQPGHVGDHHLGPTGHLPTE